MKWYKSYSSTVWATDRIRVDLAVGEEPATFRWAVMAFTLSVGASIAGNPKYSAGGTAATLEAAKSKATERAEEMAAEIRREVAEHKERSVR